MDFPTSTRPQAQRASTRSWAPSRRFLRLCLAWTAWTFTPCLEALLSSLTLWLHCPFWTHRTLKLLAVLSMRLERFLTWLTSWKRQTLILLQALARRFLLPLLPLHLSLTRWAMLLQSFLRSWARWSHRPTVWPLPTKSSARAISACPIRWTALCGTWQSWFRWKLSLNILATLLRSLTTSMKQQTYFIMLWAIWAVKPIRSLARCRDCLALTRPKRWPIWLLSRA